MVQFKETDFYHGAFITAMLHSGFRFSLLDDYEKRRSYLVERQEDEVIVYTKYIASARTNRRGGHTWAFSFTKKEVEKILNYGKPVHLAFVCGYSDEKTGGEMVTLTLQEFLECVGSELSNDTCRVTISRKKRCQPRVYGTAIVDTNSFIPEMKLLAVG